jgi:TonB family protein
MSMLLALAAAAAPAQPPPIITAPVADQPLRVLLVQPGEARCGGALQRPQRVEPPLPVAIGYAPPNQPEQHMLRLGFRIDGSGRPLSIAAPAADAPWLAGQVPDLVPSFAAWKFAPGAARADCEATFTARLVPIADAPLPDLHRLLILGQISGPAREAAYDRVRPAGSTCFSPAPRIRQQVFPAFEQIEQAPGTASYSLIGFDIDAGGRPGNVRLADSSGKAVLDRQSLDAIRRSRFAPEAKRGCTYPYWRRSTDSLAAPAAPAEGSFARPDASCPAGSVTFTHVPAATFPSEMARRGVEGWAVIGYDVAPWGSTGNVQVLAAEPADRFGLQAANIVRAARAAPSARGASGCVRRVLFRLPAEGERPPAAPED